MPAAPKETIPDASTDPGSDAGLVVDACGPGPWCERTDSILDLEGMHVLATDRRDPAKLILRVETPDLVAWCRSCGAQAKSHGRRNVPIHDAPAHGKPVVLHQG